MAKGLYLGDNKKQNPMSHQGGTNLGLQDYDAIDTLAPASVRSCPLPIISKFQKMPDHTWDEIIRG